MFLASSGLLFIFQLGVGEKGGVFDVELRCTGAGHARGLLSPASQPARQEISAEK